MSQQIGEQQREIIAKLGALATELHGLTVELKHDRQETAELKAEVADLRSDVTELKINQALLKELRGMIGKAVYILGGGIGAVFVAAIVAAVRLGG